MWSKTKKFKKLVDTPATSSDIFIGMKQIGAIDDVFCQRLVKMAEFRNGLVNLYWEIDTETLHEFIQGDLHDFKLFSQKVVKYLKQNPL